MTSFGFSIYVKMWANWAESPRVSCDLTWVLSSPKTRRTCLLWDWGSSRLELIKPRRNVPNKQHWMIKLVNVSVHLHFGTRRGRKCNEKYPVYPRIFVVEFLSPQEWISTCFAFPDSKLFLVHVHEGKELCPQKVFKWNISSGKERKFKPGTH